MKSELIENTDENKHYITIPYVINLFEKFSKNTKARFEEIGVEICIAYKPQKVGKYYSLKDSINQMYQSCLVYKFTCPDNLNNQYIGETKRQLFVRIKEHVTPTNSAVFKHIENCAYCADYTAFIIVLKSLKRAAHIMIYYLQKRYLLKTSTKF